MAQRTTRINPYDKFADEDLILRDQLAIDRTVLANERTLLAYIRTGLALILTGAGCLKFFVHPLVHAAGYCLMLLGVVIAVLGSHRFIAMNRDIQTAGSQKGG